MELREAFSIIAERISGERWLVLFLLFHVVGVHWLAGSKAAWIKIPAAICLLASAPCWVMAVRMTPTMLGGNRPMLVAMSSLLLFAGLWLFLAGNGPTEWLLGFGAAVGAGAVILFSIGQHWPAMASCLLIAPLIGATNWFSRWPIGESYVAHGGERLISAMATGVFGIVLALSLSQSTPVHSSDSLSQSRVRDFLTQPAILFLLCSGGIAVVAVSFRLWPRAATK